MTRYAFSVDLDRCLGCQACVVACGAGNETAPGEAHTTVGNLVRRRPEGLWGSFTHHRCFHCGEAPCIRVCPTGALSKWNGLTAVALEKCSGCAYCVDACPFQVPRVRSDEVAKCIGCVELLKSEQAPWCEQTCPSQAIRVGERALLVAEARARAAALRGRYPHAQVYGETQLGGLGLLLVLLDHPASYGLPEAPKPPAPLVAWQAVRPVAMGLTAGAALTLGLTFLVARRQHLREQQEERGPAVAGPAPPPGSDAIGHDEGGHD